MGKLYSLQHTGSRQIMALGLLSSAIIAFQLVLMQLIALMQWYHFAYMIISIAMLGFGAAGTILALFRKVLINNASWLVPFLMSLSGFLMVLSFGLARMQIFQFDVFVFFAERSQMGVLAANYLIFFLPFFSGALAIGILLTHHAKEIGKYYFSNLIGSGAGGILVVILLANMFAVDALPVTALLSVAAAVVAFEPGRKRLLQGLMIVAGIMIIIYAFRMPGQVPMSQYKGLSQTLLLPDAEIETSKPDIYGKIDVVHSPALHYAPAVSLSYTGKVPVRKNVFTNGEFLGVIPHYDTTQTHIHDFTTEALPFVMQRRDTVLLLNSGTGTSLAHALQNGAKHVVMVTEVSAVKELMENEYARESSELFFHDNARVLYQDSRQFLFLHDDLRFDAIVLPRMESFGGSAGLNAISENYTLTLEAFSQMWHKLADEGVIVISSWMDYPPRTTLKIAATLAKTLQNNGIHETEQYLAAVKSWGTITFVLKKSPFDSAEVDNIRQFCNDMLFDPVLLPGLQKEERSIYNQLQDDSFFDYLDEVLQDEKTQFFNQYSFYVEPATDDKPYFSRFIKPSEFLSQIREHDNLPFLELGYFIVWITLAQGALLAFILIIIPLFSLKSKSKGKAATLIYFGALGLGYMFVEIILIQRFMLYFGHPMYAISAVVSTMMIASGIGSFVSGRFRLAGKLSGGSTLIISILMLVYALVLTPLLMHTINYPLIIKILLAFALLFVPSFFMGMPFPSAIRVLDREKPDQIPWAWGINGCLSVIATALATLIAVEMGFWVVMLFSTGFYLLAFTTAIITFARPKKNIELY